MLTRQPASPCRYSKRKRGSLDRMDRTMNQAGLLLIVALIYLYRLQIKKNAGPKAFFNELPRGKRRSIKMTNLIDLIHPEGEQI